MGKFNLYQLVSITLFLILLLPQESLANERCPTYPDKLYKISFEYTTRSGERRQGNPEWGYPGAIGNIFSYYGQIYVQYSVGGRFGTQLSYLANGFEPRITSIQEWNSELPCNPNEDLPEPEPKKYLFWVDYFRGSKGILWGIFNGAPDGCTVVGAYVDGSTITRRFRGNLSVSEFDFGYHLVKSKQGYSSPPEGIDLNNLPVNYRDSKYEQYYFRANWVNPNCYWQVREVRRNSFGGIFDFLWNLFK